LKSQTTRLSGVGRTRPETYSFFGGRIMAKRDPPAAARAAIYRPNNPFAALIGDAL